MYSGIKFTLTSDLTAKCLTLLLSNFIPSITRMHHLFRSVVYSQLTRLTQSVALRVCVCFELRLLILLNQAASSKRARGSFQS
jgi:hypothetical protein